MKNSFTKFIGMGTSLEKERDRFARELRRIKDKDKRKELLESKKGQNLKFSWSLEKLNQFLETKPKFTPDNQILMEKIFKNMLTVNKEDSRFFIINNILQKLASNSETKKFLNSNLAKIFIETKNSKDLLVNFNFFQDLNIMDIGISIINNGQANTLFSMLNGRIKISNEIEKKLINIALERNHFDAIIENFFFLQNKDSIDLAEIIKSYLNQKQSVNLDSKIVKLGLLGIGRNQKSANTDFLISLIKNGFAEEAIESISKFNIEKEKLQIILEEIINSGKSKNILEIFKNYDFYGTFSQLSLDISYAFKLIQQDNVDFVINYKYIFKNYNENFNLIIEEILNSGKSSSLIKYLKNMKNLDFKVAKQLVTKGHIREVAESLESFDYKDKDDTNFILNNTLLFESINGQTRRELIANLDHKITLTEESKVSIGIYLLQSELLTLYFNKEDVLGIDQNLIFNIAKKYNKLKIIFQNLEKFQNVDSKNLELLQNASKIFGIYLDESTLELTNQIIEGKYSKESLSSIINFFLTKNLNTYFENRDFFNMIEPNTVYEQFFKLISRPNSISDYSILHFVENLNKFPNPNVNNLVESLFEGKYLTAIVFQMNELNIDQNRVFKELLKSNKFNLYLENIGKFDKLDSKLQGVLKIANTVFGGYLTQDSFILCLKILDGSVSQSEMIKLGINQKGEKGIQQLISRLNSFKKELLPKILIEEDSVIEFILINPEFLELFMKFIRYDIAEFGKGGKEKLLEELRNLQKITANKKTKTEFQRSGEVKIKVADSENKTTEEFSNEFLSRFSTIKNSIKQSLDLCNREDSQVYEIISKEFKDIKAQILEDLKNKLPTINNPKAIENLQKRIQNLENLNLPQSFEDSLENFIYLNFENLLMPLCKYQEFYPFLRKIAYYVGLKNSPTETIKMKLLTQQEKITDQSIEDILGFDDSIQEKFRDFKNRYSSDEFRRFTSTKALTDEQERIRKLRVEQSEDKKTSFEFIPTRGILMEFSGQIAGACWASRYKSIAEEFPNFTSVIMVQNPGNKFERLAGAYFLIETTSTDGTPLLVIRGLNPIENVINNMDVADFFEKTVAHAKGIAIKTGRRLAIVIDDHRGGAATNRGAVYKHLSEISQNLEKIALNEADTTFNSYNISKNTYLLN